MYHSSTVSSFAICLDQRHMSSKWKRTFVYVGVALLILGLVTNLQVHRFLKQKSNALHNAPLPLPTLARLVRGSNSASEAPSKQNCSLGEHGSEIQQEAPFDYKNRTRVITNETAHQLRVKSASSWIRKHGPLNWTLPDDFSAAHYRNRYPDLQQEGMNDDFLRVHYRHDGVHEGRNAGALSNSREFVNIVRQHSKATLEIGPFCSPQIRGLPGRVYQFADVLDQHQLYLRALSLGMKGLDCPFIDYVCPAGDFGNIPRSFEAVLSSHNIEHQIDFLGHLHQIEDLLVDGGYFLLKVPDKRFVFDAPFAVSTIADVLDSHFQPTLHRVHSLKSVIEHVALTTHSEVMRRWNDYLAQFRREQGPTPPAAVSIPRVKEALRIWQSRHDYIDVHKWFFTPDSFHELITVLHEMKLTQFSVVRLFPTLTFGFEFWVILQKQRP